MDSENWPFWIKGSEQVLFAVNKMLVFGILLLWGLFRFIDQQKYIQAIEDQIIQDFEDNRRLLMKCEFYCFFLN